MTKQAKIYILFLGFYISCNLVHAQSTHNTLGTKPSVEVLYYKEQIDDQSFLQGWYFCSELGMHFSTFLFRMWIGSNSD